MSVTTSLAAAGPEQHCSDFDPDAALWQRVEVDTRVEIVAAAIDTWCDGPLGSAESRVASGMCEERKRAFSAGRNLARRLLAELGRPTPDLPRLANGAIDWPDGISGSLSHSETQVAAAVSVSPEVTGIGVDLQRMYSVHPGLWSRLMHPEELADIDNDKATVLFSMKEALFKSLRDAGTEWRGFSEVKLTDVGHELARRGYSQLAASGFPGMGAYTAFGEDVLTLWVRS